MSRTENAVYLIDSENIGYRWIDTLTEMKPDDRIVLFYSNPQVLHKSIDLLIEKNPQVNMTAISCSAGTANAMDFQIVFYLAYSSRTQPPVKHCILSDDKGFDAIKGMCKRYGLQVERVCGKKDSSAAPTKPAHVPAKPAAPAPKAPRQIAAFKDIPPSARKHLTSLMKSKYNSQANQLIAYKAIISGHPSQIDSAVATITKGSTTAADAETMRNHWRNCIPYFKRLEAAYCQSIA